jgi:hypothetical protein
MTTRLARHAREGVVCLLLVAAAAVAPVARAAQPTFETPEAAVRALIDAARLETADTLLALFGAEGASLVDTSDPVTARRNRDVFVAAVGEGWHLVDEGEGRKSLLVGRERWPFPVPIVRRDAGWSFDAAAGKEEVLARRVGRNELAAIRVSRVYVAAQRLYARTAHDGQPAGLYAQRLRSEDGRQNGLYWPAGRGEARSPLGDLLARAAIDKHKGSDAEPVPFHGYYYRVLTAQGASAPGGKKDYLKAGRLSEGFGLVAWPAEYGVSGIMTFIVNQDGVVREQDLGPETATIASRMQAYDPDAGWVVVQP